jgi:hypothetical protein
MNNIILNKYKLTLVISKGFCVTIFGHSFANDKPVNERTTKIAVENSMMNDLISVLFGSCIYRRFQSRARLYNKGRFLRTLSGALYNHQ